MIKANSTAAAASDWTPNPTAHTLSLPEQIAERIGNDIIQGRFERGHRIQEQDLAAQFQVSRGPVREALRILERDGLLQIHARRGAQVTELNVAELNGIFDARICLSGLAARRAAERRDAVAMPRLKAAIDRVCALSATADTDTFVKAVYVAHQLICEASGNPFLTRLVLLPPGEACAGAAGCGMARSRGTRGGAAQVGSDAFASRRLCASTRCGDAFGAMDQRLIRRL